MIKHELTGPVHRESHHCIVLNPHSSVQWRLHKSRGAHCTYPKKIKNALKCKNWNEKWTVHCCGVLCIRSVRGYTWGAGWTMHALCIAFVHCLLCVQCTNAHYSLLVLKRACSAVLERSVCQQPWSFFYDASICFSCLCFLRLNRWIQDDDVHLSSL